MGLFSKKKQPQNTCDCNGCGDNVSKQPVVQEMEGKSEGITVKVLGSGCKKCNQLTINTGEALKRLGMNETIGHVTDFATIAGYGVMTTPALVVNEKVVLYGKVAKTEEIMALLQKDGER